MDCGYSTHDQNCPVLLVEKFCGLIPSERSLVCPICGSVRPDDGAATDLEVFHESECAECIEEEEDGE